MARFDRQRFAKLRALYASTEHAGEREAAARAMGIMARAAGLTVAQAMAEADHQSAAIAQRRQADDEFLDALFGAA